MKITYYTQRYRPEYEAISQEVRLLAQNFSQKNKIKIHNLHLDGLFNFKFNRNFISSHFFYYPLFLLYTYFLSRKSDLNHIYTSLGDLPYLPVLSSNKTILTAAASCRIEKVKKRVSYLRKLAKIMVESRKQKEELISLGINPEKIEIVYPPVNLELFHYVPPEKKVPFQILYASCPTREKDFEKRGIFLLLELALREKNIQINLAWRNGAYHEMEKKIRESSLTNINLKNEIVSDMNNLYAQAHCTIIPYTKYDDFLKLIPNSILGSLAAGKPLLVSRRTEIAEIVQQAHCGVVFEPNVASLQKAIVELQKNYFSYQKNCRPLASRFFSQENFLKKYEEIYSQIR